MGEFQVDVNGNDAPNIVGRDVFLIYITKKGRIYGYGARSNITDINQLTNRCKISSYAFCLDVIMNSGWKMPY